MKRGKWWLAPLAARRPGCVCVRGALRAKSKSATLGGPLPEVTPRRRAAAARAPASLRPLRSRPACPACARAASSSRSPSGSAWGATMAPVARAQPRAGAQGRVRRLRDSSGACPRSRHQLRALSDSPSRLSGNSVSLEEGFVQRSGRRVRWLPSFPAVKAVQGTRSAGSSRAKSAAPRAGRAPPEVVRRRAAGLLSQASAFPLRSRPSQLREVHLRCVLLQAVWKGCVFF